MRTPPRILIVDDEPINLDILQTRLASTAMRSSPQLTVKRRWPLPQLSNQT